MSRKLEGGGAGGSMRPASSNSKPNVSKNSHKNRINATHFIQKFDDHEDIKTGIREVLLRLEPLGTTHILRISTFIPQTKIEKPLGLWSSP